MSTLPEPTGGDFELPPAGTHLAVAYRVIDLGTQKGTYMGAEKIAHKIMISWELPEEMMANGKPFTVSQWYTWSMSEKATLRKHLEAWRGLAFGPKDFGANGFNIKKILGTGCLLTITHTDKGENHYANISSVSKLMKGMKAPALINEQAYLWLSHELWEPSAFFKLSQGLQAVIMKSPEYAKLNGADDEEVPPDDYTPSADHFPDDQIPF